jgi:hypothetical protein
MPIDFPTNPISGQTYSYNSITWEYNGVAWDKQGGGGSVGPQGNTGATGPQGNTGATGPVGDYVNSVNGITGAINLAAGSNITITPSGLTLTIASTGGGAGFTRSINVITSSTTAGGTASVDYVYIGNTSGNINLTLPTAVSNANRYTVKNSNIGILTVLTTSSQTIDGVTGYNLSKQFQAIDLLSDNSNWVVV